MQVMRLNVQDNGVQPLLNDLNFRFTPTFILLDATGKEAWRTNGSIDPDTINAELASLPSENE